MENQINQINQLIANVSMLQASLLQTYHPGTQAPPPQLPTKPEQLDLLTIKEAANILRKSDKTVLNWIKQGKIPAITSNPSGKRQHFTIRRQVIENYLNNNTT